jgi:hypothetical protein
LKAAAAMSTSSGYKAPPTFCLTLTSMAISSPQ